jgi:hypothetical protein
VIRLLLDPTATEGGGAATPPAAPAPPIPADFVAELKGLRELVGTLTAAQQADAATKAAREQEELLRKGQLDEIRKQTEAALKLKDDALAGLREKVMKSELDRAITAALADHQLVPGAVSQVKKLIADGFEVSESGDGFSVRSRADLREPKAVVAEFLASEEGRHFVKAEHRGGAGAGSNANPAPGHTAPVSPADAIRDRLRAKYGTAPK